MADEQKSQGYTVEDLGKAMKQKNPGKYDGWSDADIGSAIQQKHPGKYDQFKTSNPSQPPNPLSVMPGGGPVPTQKPSGEPPRSAYQDFIVNRPTGKEWAGMAVDALPMIGAGAAAAAGPPGWAAGFGMAALGGAAGQTVRHGVVAGIGPEDLSGPHTQVEPPPSDPMDFAFDVAKTGAEQALFEGAGRIFSGLIGGPLHAAGAKAENAGVKAVAKRYGLTAGQVSGNPAAKAVEKVGEYGLASRWYLVGKASKSVKEGVAALDQVLDTLHMPTSPAHAGESTKGVIRLSRDVFDEQARQLYWDLSQAAQGTMVDMGSIKAISAAKLADDAALKKMAGKTSGYGSKTIAQLEDASKLPDQMSFNDAHKWRQGLRKITEQTDEMRSKELPAEAQQLVRDVTGAMDNAAKSLNPTAHSLWVDAREFYTKGMGILNHDAITSLLGKNSADVVGAIQPKIGDTSTARLIREAILDYPTKYGNFTNPHTGVNAASEAKRTWAEFQQQFVRTRIIEDPEHIGEGFTVDRLGAIKKNLHEMGPGVMKEVLGSTPDGQMVLDNLTNIGEAFSRVDKLPSAEKMLVYRALEGGAVAASGGILNHPVSSPQALVMLEVIPNVVAWVTHSKTATKYMLDGLRGITEAGMKVKPTNLAKRGIINISKGATKAVDATSKSAFSKASADIARAAEYAWEEYGKYQPQPEAKSDKTPGPPPGPPKTLDIFKGWQ